MMMTRVTSVFFLWLAFGAAGAATPAADLGPGMTNPGYQEKPAWFKDSFLDIREDVAEASSGNRRVMLYFYQDGCPYCAKLLNDNFGDSRLAEKTQANFDVIAINLWGDREVTGFDGTVTTEKAFGSSLRVQYTPTLLMLDDQGGVILRINGYFPPHKFDVALDFVAGRHENAMSFREFHAQQSPVPASGELQQLPAALPRPVRLADDRVDSYRPLLVMFEQKTCPSCDELHRDILARPAVATALSNVDAVVLDMWSDEPIQTPDGRDTSSRAWARELRINYAPSMVFFDTAGNEVFRTEGYLRTFHVHGAIDYVVSGAYSKQPNFQRYLQHRTHVLEAHGLDINLME